MAFPNAYRGIRKLFTAGILYLISAVCVLTSIITGVQALTADSFEGIKAGGAGAVILLAAGSILPVAASAISMVGLQQGYRDVEYFHTAFKAAVAVLLLGLGNAALLPIGMQGINWINAVTALQTACCTIVYFFITQGILNLAIRAKNDPVYEATLMFIRVTLVLFIIKFILDLAVMVVKSISLYLAAGRTLSVISGITEILICALYLACMYKAKQMLAPIQGR